MAQKGRMTSRMMGYFWKKKRIVASAISYIKVTFKHTQRCAGLETPKPTSIQSTLKTSFYSTDTHAGPIRYSTNYNFGGHVIRPKHNLNIWRGGHPDKKEWMMLYKRTRCHTWIHSLLQVLPTMCSKFYSFGRVLHDKCIFTQVAKQREVCWMCIKGIL